MPATRVSKSMKRLAVVAALAAAILLVWYLRRPRATIDAAPVPTFHNPPPIAHATKITPHQREKLAEAIARGQAARGETPSSSTSSGATAGGHAAISAPKPPRLPDSVLADEPAISKSTIRDAMREVVPMLSDCYEAAIPTLAHPDIKVTVKFTLSGDPDIGTLVDADQIFDDANQPLPAKFDDCLRSTIQSIALPPLAEGDQIAVNYPFVFAQAPPDEAPPSQH